MMIISASRRTDIPAHYTPWLLNRVRAGYCLVPNPFNVHQVQRVSLLPPDVAAIVFWSKNPAPLLAHLDELDSAGLRYYFLVTVNAYDSRFEPALPPLDQRIETLLQLADRLGPRRVIWRYDPIIISNCTPFDFHERAFRQIASQVKGRVARCIISVVDFYRRTDRRLRLLTSQGVLVDPAMADISKVAPLLSELRRVADACHIDIQSCAEPPEVQSAGIRPGACIDADLIRAVWGIDCRPTKDSGQRRLCKCVVSKDIGVNDTCTHGCVYCYATRDLQLARQRHESHDPDSPILWGQLPRNGPNRQLRLF